MSETQLSFFDAPASRSHQRTQKDKELETLLVQHLGVNGAKKWQKKVTKQQAKLDAFLNQPRTPEQERQIAKAFLRRFERVQNLW